MDIQILSQPFLINPDFALRLGMIVNQRLAEGKSLYPGMGERQNTPKAGYDEDGEIVLMDHTWYVNYLKTSSNKTFPTVSIQGVMSRYGNCSYGNEDFIKQIQLLDKDPDVKGIILSMDSYGGTVDSTQELADAVRYAKKPVVAYVKHAACSAAYWVASQADRIVMSPETTSIVGSIGVLMVYENIKEMLEKQGRKVEIIRDAESIDKAKPNSIEPLTDAERQGLIDSMSGIKETFKSYVKQGRAGVLKSSEVFTGKTYCPKEAFKLGLVDKVGTIKDAYTLIKSIS